MKRKEADVGPIRPFNVFLIFAFGIFFTFAVLDTAEGNFDGAIQNVIILALLTLAGMINAVSNRVDKI